MRNIKPFFINSNICLEEKDIYSQENFFSSIAGNIGNSYITYSLIKELFGGLVNINHIQNIYEYDFTHADKDIDFINNECTHVFLILQDQIRIIESYNLQLPYLSIINFIKKLNKPVIIAGLGMNSLDDYDKDFHKKLNPELINFLKFLSDNCIEIGIRGHFTEEILNNLDIKNINVIGCPSFYEMGRNRVLTKKKKINDSKILLSSSFHSKLLNNNHQIMQCLAEEKIINAVAFDNLHEDIIENEFKMIQSGKYHIFSGIEQWKNFVSKFDFTIGYRLHGSILSINAGVPALCCSEDYRAKEMCELLKIPINLAIEPNKNIIELYEELDYSEMNKNYPKLYDNFENFLNNNKLRLFKEDNIKYNYIKQPELVLYSKKLKKSLSKHPLNKELKYRQIKMFINKIFSIENKNQHKIITIMGLKFKF